MENQTSAAIDLTQTQNSAGDHSSNFNQVVVKSEPREYFDPLFDHGYACQSHIPMVTPGRLEEILNGTETSVSKNTSSPSCGSFVMKVQPRVRHIRIGPLPCENPFIPLEDKIVGLQTETLSCHQIPLSTPHKAIYMVATPHKEASVQEFHVRYVSGTQQNGETFIPAVQKNQDLERLDNITPHFSSQEEENADRLNCNIPPVIALQDEDNLNRLNTNDILSAVHDGRSSGHSMSSFSEKETWTNAGYSMPVLQDRSSYGLPCALAAKKGKPPGYDISPEDEPVPGILVKNQNHVVSQDTFDDLSANIKTENPASFDDGEQAPSAVADPTTMEFSVDVSKVPDITDVKCESVSVNEDDQTIFVNSWVPTYAPESAFCGDKFPNDIEIELPSTSCDLELECYDEDDDFDFDIDFEDDEESGSGQSGDASDNESDAGSWLSGSGMDENSDDDDDIGPLLTMVRHGRAPDNKIDAFRIRDTVVTKSKRRLTPNHVSRFLNNLQARLMGGKLDTKMKPVFDHALDLTMYRRNEKVFFGNIDSLRNVDKADNQSDTALPKLSVQCILCGHLLFSVDALSTHLSTGHGTSLEEPYRCEQCQSLFSGVAPLNNHILDKHPSRYWCRICGLKCKDITSMRKHGFIHNPRYICDDCGKPFGTQQQATDHAIETNHMPEYRKRRGAKIATSSVQCENQKEHSLKIYKCLLCDFSCCLSIGLVLHHVSHTGIDDNSCPHCNKVYSSKTIAAKHLKSCQNRQKKAERRLRDFVNHKAAHRDEFQCHVCGKIFKRELALTIHMKSHEQSTVAKGKFQCDICGNHFKTKAIVTRHMKRHFGQTMNVDPEHDCC